MQRYESIQNNAPWRRLIFALTISQQIFGYFKLPNTDYVDINYQQKPQINELNQMAMENFSTKTKNAEQLMTSEMYQPSPYLRFVGIWL